MLVQNVETRIWRPRHMPLRRCAGCGTQRAKRELVRIVKTSTGTVGVDASGKQTGRGAYLCHQHGCWEKGLKKNRLDYVLRGPISSGDQQLLREYAQTRLGGDPVRKGIDE